MRPASQRLVACAALLGIAAAGTCIAARARRAAPVEAFSDNALVATIEPPEAISPPAERGEDTAPPAPAIPGPAAGALVACLAGAGAALGLRSLQERSRSKRS